MKSHSNAVSEEARKVEERGCISDSLVSLTDEGPIDPFLPGQWSDRARASTLG